MNFLIREAKSTDVFAMHQMIVDLAIYEKEPDAVLATPADLEAALFSSEKSGKSAPALYAHVAEVDGEVVGMAIWFLNYSTWLGTHGIYLEDLYVKPEHRGTGVGKALLKKLAQVCVENGFSRFQWWVLDWNEPAIEFYRSHGAIAMDEWVVYRLSGDALESFAKD
jgi:GNAT superfamily N-acetyltransferase